MGRQGNLVVIVGVVEHVSDMVGGFFFIQFLNNLPSVVKNLSRCTFITSGGKVQCGGVQLDRTYILGS